MRVRSTDDKPIIIASFSAVMMEFRRPPKATERQLMEEKTIITMTAAADLPPTKERSTALDMNVMAPTA